MAKKKDTPPANAPENTPLANGNATVVSPEDEKKKAERKEARAAQTEAQSTVARAFKNLAKEMTEIVNSDNFNFPADYKDMVFEIINAGDAALAVGFPKLDRPKAARGASVEALKTQISEARHRAIENEITWEEADAIVYTLMGKICRLQAAEKKKAKAEAAKTEQTETASA